VAVRLAARVSDEKRIRGVVREMRYTNRHLYLLLGLPQDGADVTQNWLAYLYTSV